MKFGALCCVYDDETWLKDSFESIYSSCATIYYVVNDKPWHGPSTDNSCIISALNNLPDPDKKIRIIKGSWPQLAPGETEQRNAGLKLIEQAGMDYCFIVDSDEIYDSGVLLNMMNFASRNPQIECWHTEMDTYWKSYQYVIRPLEPCRPAIFIKLGVGAYFTSIREVNAKTRTIMPPNIGFYHHMSYARSDEQVKKKISMFSHADEIVAGWYENIWKGWDEDNNMTDLHPTCPHCYAKAIRRPISELPEVLRKRLGGI